jgi:hypothetical protein
MITYYLNSKKKQAPGSFAEMDKGSLRLYFQLVVENVPADSLRMIFALHFIGRWKAGQVKALAKKFTKNPDRWHDNYENVMSSLGTLADALSFLTSGKRLIEQCPFACTGLRIGTAQDFSNLTYWDFMLIDKFMSDFRASGDIVCLKKMASVLFRRISIVKLFCSLFTQIKDIRVTTPDDPKSLQMAMWKYSAMLAWVDTFMASLPQKYPLTFQKGEGEEGSWTDILMGISGSIPGKEEEVSQLPFILILERLEYTAREAERLKAKD